MTQKLYILVRTDLASMTTGRIAAQAAHAANQFVGYAKELIECLDDPNDPFIVNFNEWENQTPDHFGTVIVLNGGTEGRISDKLNELDFKNYITGQVIDPEYSIKDGDHTWFLKNVLTCGYAFSMSEQETALKDMKLL